MTAAPPIIRSRRIIAAFLPFARLLKRANAFCTKWKARWHYQCRRRCFCFGMLRLGVAAAFWTAWISDIYRRLLNAGRQVGLPYAGDDKLANPSAFANRLQNRIWQRQVDSRDRENAGDMAIARLSSIGFGGFARRVVWQKSNRHLCAISARWKKKMRRF